MARPRGSTKERILDVALQFFNERGYDKTSLREIAEELGITKAALYYYFETKQQILLELHLRLHALGQGILDEMDKVENRRDALAAWPRLVDELIDEVVANRDLFLLHQRNQNAFAAIVDDPRHQAANEDVEERFRALLQNQAIPLGDRVRMACAMGAVLTALMGSNALFGEDVPSDEVVKHVRAAVRDLVRG